MNPALIANFKISDTLFFLPELRYVFTSKVLQRHTENFISTSKNGYSASLKLVFKTSENSWLWLTPAYTTINHSINNVDFEIDISYVVRIFNRVGLTAYLKRNFNQNTYHLQLINSIYF
jgi:hypothetical protein